MLWWGEQRYICSLKRENKPKLVTKQLQHNHNLESQANESDDKLHEPVWNIFFAAYFAVTEVKDYILIANS